MKKWINVIQGKLSYLLIVRVHEDENFEKFRNLEKFCFKILRIFMHKNSCRATKKDRKVVNSANFQQFHMDGRHHQFEWISFELGRLFDTLEILTRFILKDKVFSFMNWFDWKTEIDQETMISWAMSIWCRTKTKHHSYSKNYFDASIISFAFRLFKTFVQLLKFWTGLLEVRLEIL